MSVVDICTQICEVFKLHNKREHVNNPLYPIQVLLKLHNQPAFVFGKRNTPKEPWTTDDIKKMQQLLTQLDRCEFNNSAAYYNRLAQHRITEYLNELRI